MCLSQSNLRVCQCKLLLRPFCIPNFSPTYAKCHFALSSSQLCKIPLRSNLASFCVLFPVWRPPSASGKRFCFEMEVKEGRAHFENRINKTWSWSPKATVLKRGSGFSSRSGQRSICIKDISIFSLIPYHRPSSNNPTPVTAPECLPAQSPNPKFFFSF